MPYRWRTADIVTDAAMDTNANAAASAASATSVAASVALEAIASQCPPCLHGLLRT